MENSIELLLKLLSVFENSVRQKVCYTGFQQYHISLLLNKVYNVTEIIDARNIRICLWTLDEIFFHNVVTSELNISEDVIFRPRATF